jgi:hypothetical protein
VSPKIPKISDYVSFIIFVFIVDFLHIKFH